MLIPNSGSRPISGVNVCGYLRTESGVGAVTRGYVRALRAASIDVDLLDLSDICGNRAQDVSLDLPPFSCQHDVNIVCVDIEKQNAAIERIGEQRFAKCYNIGVWWWELSRFPEKWLDRFADYDEIWVGTSFVASALAPVSPVPVVRIPPNLEIANLGSRQIGRSRIDATEADVVYLFIFDFNSICERKNPLAVVNAFKRAFGPSDSTKLVIKCVNERANPTAFAALASAMDLPSMRILTGYWSATELNDLVAACDVYVSLHRSEGAGLTISAAMAHGKPVIATGWSGNMDFMNVSNSYPVQFDLVQLRDSAGPYRAGETWAEPSLEHAAELMRHTYVNRDEAEARGTRAKQSLAADFSESRVGELIRSRLDAIAIRRNLNTIRDQKRAALRDYKLSVDEVKSAVAQSVPSGARAVVISKGDDELLRLPNIVASHFPQSTLGGYAGCYPKDSAAAIAHLEALRETGLEYLVVPSAGYWWFEHYAGFRDHLARYRKVLHDDTCAIYALRTEQPASARRSIVHSARTRAKLAAVIVPTRAEERQSILDNLWLWNRDGFAPMLHLENRTKSTLVFYFNNESGKELEQEIAETFQRADLLNRCFSSVEFRYLSLHGDDDLYDRSGVQRGKHRSKAGPNNQFFDIVSQAAQFGDYILYMETDCIPIRPDWLGQLQDLVQHAEPFWVLGSAYRGNSVLERTYAKHINGNAVYAVGNAQFQEFVAKVWRPGLATILSRDPHCAYDTAVETVFGCARSNNPHDPIWKLSQATLHKFRHSDFVRNYCGPADTEYPVPQLIESVLRESPTTHLVHGKQFSNAVRKMRLMNIDFIEQASEDQKEFAISTDETALVSAAGEAFARRFDTQFAEYDELVSDIRQFVDSNIPQSYEILVASKGDETLVRFDNHSANHFPQSPDGRYAGCYPADDLSAIAHLEELRAEGAQCLLFPKTSLWWLKHYPEFGKHLYQRYSALTLPGEIGLIFNLENVNSDLNRPTQSVGECEPDEVVHRDCQNVRILTSESRLVGDCKSE